MSRRLDLVIFGASGYTGKYAVEEAARVSKKNPNITWAIAGRSKDKLENVLIDLTKITGDDYSSIQIIIADVKDEESLKAMCSQAKVLVSCCGPYAKYGEAVVKAAIESKTHYVDVSGEPMFMESMQLKYNKMAADAGVYVISACGFDSIPNDMGVVFLQKNFGGILNTVESYLSTDVEPEFREEARKTGLIHYGTWESLVNGLTTMSELGSLRKQLYPEPMPQLKPKLERRSVLHRSEGRWCVPFPGSDSSVVYRSQRHHLAQRPGYRPVQFRAYVRMESFFAALFTVFGAVVLYVMTKTSFTKELLLKHPRLFSGGMITREEPRRELQDATKFRMVLIGKGWPEGADVENSAPDKIVKAKVSGKSVGYGMTTMALIQSALTIIDEKNKMPQPGGVLTTSAAFYDTSLIEKLNENNLKFEIVEDKE